MTTFMAPTLAVSGTRGSEIRDVIQLHPGDGTKTDRTAALQLGT